MQTAIIELRESEEEEPLKTEIVERRPNEKNFVNCVGRFVYQNKLDSNHLIEKWYKEQNKIVLIITKGPSYTKGECF